MEEYITIKVTKEFKDKFSKLAEIKGLKTSTYARMVLIEKLKSLETDEAK